ncbi:MAG TPA: chalcone isomerase family protein [Burkholderiaceae bacterium]|nr:chalcone isomerase family protein [Burkholderiaceae bacterium]
MTGSTERPLAGMHPHAGRLMRRRDPAAAPMKTTQTMKRRMTSAIVAALLASAAQAACAAEHSGVQFDDSVQLAGTELQLNGLGLRSLFILKAYVAGLYVPERSSHAADLLAQTGPRRLALKMLVEMSPERMTKAFRDGLTQNLNESQMTALRPQVDQLAESMRAMGPARKGDVVDIDLIDGQIQVLLNGQPRGEPIAGEAFFNAILQIFIGPRPVDRELKRGLLGG